MFLFTNFTKIAKTILLDKGLFIAPFSPPPPQYFWIEYYRGNFIFQHFRLKKVSGL